MNHLTSLQVDDRNTHDDAELSLHAYELEALDALTDDGLTKELGACGVEFFTVPLILT